MERDEKNHGFGAQGVANHYDRTELTKRCGLGISVALAREKGQNRGRVALKPNVHWGQGMQIGIILGEKVSKDTTEGGSGYLSERGVIKGWKGGKKKDMWVGSSLHESLYILTGVRTASSAEQERRGKSVPGQGKDTNGTWDGAQREKGEF